jgi:enoyl-CoA hydratase/carnithine racemase
MSDRVSVAISEGIADVRLNRPEKMNALDPAMFQALYETGRAVADDPDVRVVVLSGEGRCFSAGLDTSNFAAMAGGGSVGTAGGGRRMFDKPEGSVANYAQQPGWIWRDLPIPVIAAVHGVAYGGGLQIALGADIRFVAPDARMSVMEIKWGLIPDMSGTQTLRNLVRLDVAKDLTFTGRVVSGTEAGEIGMATYVTEQPLEDALAMARVIASKSPSAIRSAKALLNDSVVGSFEEGLAREARSQAKLIGKPEQIETVKAQLEGRPAAYAPGRENSDRENKD